MVASEVLCIGKLANHVMGAVRANSQTTSAGEGPVQCGNIFSNKTYHGGSTHVKEAAARSVEY